MIGALEIFVAAVAVHPKPKRGAARCAVKGNSKEIRRYGKRLGLGAKKSDERAEKSLTNALRMHLEAAIVAGRWSPVHMPHAVEVRCRFLVPIPENFPAWRRAAALAGRLRPVTRPDRGNMLKLLEDAVAGAGFVDDDSQIVGGPVEKFYGEVPGYLIELTRLETPTKPPKPERLARPPKAWT